MSDLQDALDCAEDWGGVIEFAQKAIMPKDGAALILEAARRVANLDIDAATKIVNGLRHVTTEDGWDDSIEVFAEAAVKAALHLDDSE